MIGPEDKATAGDISLDDSSSRHKTVAVSDKDTQPGNFGELRQPAQSPLEKLALSPVDIVELSESRESYQGWIEGLRGSLSPIGARIVDTSFFSLLKDVPNSTAAHSKVLSHVDVTRWEHCIHAGYLVGVLAQTLGLTPYEQSVMEAVMLLHDPHRKGSHALDRAFASMPGSPADFHRWWAGHDYHEYHGAKVVARDPQLRTILTKYHADVCAVLTRDDKRPIHEKLTEYGELRGVLSSQRIESLYRIKDELDRVSYLTLDYLRSGFKPAIIAQAIRDVNEHALTLSAQGSGMQINIHRGNSARPFDKVAEWRHLFRRDVATAPHGDLVEAIIRAGIWEQAKERFDRDQLRFATVYEFVRDRALRGEYHEIFSAEALELLKAGETGIGLSVEDCYAPIVTMTLADLRPGAAREAVTVTVPVDSAERLCGAPRGDVSFLEYEIRDALRKAGLGDKVHILVSDDFNKTFTYHVSHDGEAPVEERVFKECPPSLIKVIIAARALDSDGKVIDLSETKRIVDEHLRSSGLLIPDRIEKVLTNFNPRGLCEPIDDSGFTDTIREKIHSFVPEWMKRGGCGLIERKRPGASRPL